MNDNQAPADLLPGDAPAIDAGFGDIDGPQVGKDVAGGVMRYGREEKLEGNVLHILTPSRGQMAVETVHWLYSSKAIFRAANFRYTTWSPVARLPIDKAREHLADRVVRAMTMDQFKHMEHWVLWLDDDMVPWGNCLLPLVYEMVRHPEISVLSALCSRKQENDFGIVFGPENGEQLIPDVHYKPGELVETHFCGLGFALHPAKLFQEIRKPYFHFQDGVAEDLWFGRKLALEGHRSFVHTGVQVGHINSATGRTYYPSLGAPVKQKSPMQPMVLVDNLKLGDMSG